MLRAGAAAAIASSVPLTAHGRQATPAAGQAPDPAAIDRFASEAIEQYGVPGASVAVVLNGEPLLVAGYGVRSVDAADPVDVDTVFQLASNTKPMTAFTLATLVDEGTVEWTTTASEVIPELRLMDTYAELHADSRDFLAHRSGFPAFTGDQLDEFGYSVEETLRRLRYLPPGSSFRDVAAYSNLGYTVVGEMIARLTGGTWEAAMNERLFAALGMTRSGASMSDLPDDGNVSAVHAVVDGETVTVEPFGQPYVGGAIGAGGSAISTASDMARWMMTLLAGGMADGQQVVQADTVRTMFDPVMPSEVSFTETPPISATAGFSYGLGWGNFHWRGYEIMEKGGALPGIRTVVDLVPELGLGVAVMANMNLTFLPEAIRAFVLEQFIGPADTDMQATIFGLGAQLDAAFAAPEPPPDALPIQVPLDDLTGTYDQNLFGEIRVVADGDSLRIEAGPAGRPGALIHYSLNTFLLDLDSPTQIPEELTFVLGPEGQAVAFEHESWGRFDRVET
jgi:CubicO group peptidase (beta-lactamase class C family)